MWSVIRNFISILLTQARLYIILYFMSYIHHLQQSCKDILYKNMEYQNQEVYLLYDTESPLAKILSDAFVAILPHSATTRLFLNPPQPLYRGGFINPENPYNREQNRVVTSHNIHENERFGLLHHHLSSHVQHETSLKHEHSSDSIWDMIKTELLSLPPWSIVVLIQSTNFRLSTFRIRLELFHRGIHVVEFNHLAYIPDSQFETFFSSITYRTDIYKEQEQKFAIEISRSNNLEKVVEIISSDDSELSFWSLEGIRGNTGEYSSIEKKWWTFPLGEIFTEALDLESVSGTCLVDAFPNDDFSVNFCEPFSLAIKKWRVLPSDHFPSEFQKIYDWIMEFEGEVMVRELGLGLNPAISLTTPLSDINFFERKLGVHLSLGKKHGIYGKKLPKNELQRFHIDIFLSIADVKIGGKSVYRDWNWHFS